jgi:thiosulfate dehydrogenase [quinone] large subunit
VPLTEARVPAYALLPLRFFFGATFLYAGIDKLISPTFFDASAPDSIVGQMAAFARDSPLSPLIKVVEPWAVPIGLAIAIAEIAIGIGALSGLAFRVAAVGGATLSIMFWLTASWATRPYYYGPDLPYAVGWITLAVAGHGGILVPRAILAMGGSPPEAVRPGRPRPREVAVSPERRALLQTGALAGLAVLVASFAVPFRLLGADATRPTPSPDPGGTGSGTGQGSSSPGASTLPAGGSTAPAGGIKVATISSVTSQGSAAFTVPLTAPAPLPAGDPGVIVRLQDGTFVAYDAVCTHEGCTVEWDAPDGVLFCPCHGAAFDPADHAAVLQGPTNRPLAPLPIVVDEATGTIYLKA